jgi:hypothetical protein
VYFRLSLSSFGTSPFLGGKRGRYVERMSRQSINTRVPVWLPMNRKRSMYLLCLIPESGSFNTWLVSFIILSYQSFSDTSNDRPAYRATFGLARSISLCHSALSVPPRACKTKRKCSPTVCPSSRELMLWNHFKNCSAVPLLNIGWTCTVGLYIF